MRIWSLHPEYLDTKGILALWRETLLAKNVLEGKTKGYKNHPQLNRFKSLNNPVEAIHQYLSEVYTEALTRGYRFDSAKFLMPDQTITMPVTKGQVEYERIHLLNKLQQRDVERFEKLKLLKKFKLHPIFSVAPGDVEDWEIR
ncbi:MAG: hypothetical protein BGN92_13815 [Sphingobacteriales bacterium 41-5]|mgnify:CR=1 FL=1|nr:MAG: hypothetical protein BGN92_13815 [Sphingobacteriales bacterium 41-5]